MKLLVPGFWVLNAWLMVLGGCAGDSSSMGEDQYCVEVARRECAQVGNRCSFKTSDCEPVRVVACRMRAAASRSSTRVFHPENTQACFDAVTNTYKEAIITPALQTSLTAACEGVFRGSTPAFSACTIDYDCSKGLICDKKVCATLKMVARGDGCANPGDTCPLGQFCTKNPSDIYQCSARQGRGQSCASEVPCLESLRCLQGQCMDKLERGDSCNKSDDCGPDLLCDPYLKVCAVGLQFAGDSSSCKAFAGASLGSGAPDAAADASTRE